MNEHTNVTVQQKEMNFFYRQTEKGHRTMADTDPLANDDYTE